jgi:hypothetical protein
MKLEWRYECTCIQCEYKLYVNALEEIGNSKYMNTETGMLTCPRCGLTGFHIDRINLKQENAKFDAWDARMREYLRLGRKRQ